MIVLDVKGQVETHCMTHVLNLLRGGVLTQHERDRVTGHAQQEEDQQGDAEENWYHLQNCQQPVIHGPGRQPTSEAIFVTTRGPGDLLYSYAAETASGPEIAGRGPRQFADAALSHCAWGSPCSAPEFMGGDRI